MHLFFFEHMTVVEGMMERLHSCVEHAYLHKDMFVHLMMEGSQDMQQVGNYTTRSSIYRAQVKCIQKLNTVTFGLICHIIFLFFLWGVGINASRYGL
jgi:hypothetical protein